MGYLLSTRTVLVTSCEGSGYFVGKRLPAGGITVSIKSCVRPARHVEDMEQVAGIGHARGRHAWQQ